MLKFQQLLAFNIYEQNKFQSNSEGRDVFPCDFRAKIDFFALNDCLYVIIMENDGVQFFRLLEPIL